MSMLVYPQLRSGALSQFPIQKRRRLRTVVNNSADERAVRLADPAGQFTEWRLEYSDLADDEIAALQQFFEQAEGTLNGFTFLDPTSNLLAWSDQLDNAVWQRGPLLSIASGASDEAGGTLAWHVTNSGGGAQNLSQTLAAPAGYLYCFSAYVRSAATTTATMLLAGLRHDIAITPGWARVMMAGSGDAAAESIAFGVEIQAGGAVDVYGMQVEPQAGASVHKPTTSGGVYENARLRDDTLSITTTGVNRHSSTVSIIHADHL